MYIKLRKLFFQLSLQTISLSFSYIIHQPELPDSQENYLQTSTDRLPLTKTYFFTQFAKNITNIADID